MTAKSTKNSPTDAFADFVPSNVRPPKRRVLGDCANIHKTGALSLGAEQEQPTACVPGAGGCKGLILLRPLNAGRRRLPRRTTCGWFWCYLLPSKGSYAPRAKTAVVLIPLQARMRRFKTASRGEGGILREHGRTCEQGVFALVRMFACSQSRIHSSQNAKCRFSPHLSLTITFHYTHYIGECPL